MYSPLALILLVGIQLCVGIPRQRQADIDVLEGARVNCKVSATITYPDAASEAAIPTVECDSKCGFKTEDKDQSYFIGYVYRHFERLEEEYGLMLEIRYARGGERRCVLVPANFDEDILSIHSENNSPCASITIPTTLPPSTTTTPFITHDFFSTTTPTTILPSTTTTPFITHDPAPTTTPTTIPPSTTTTPFITQDPIPTTVPTTLPPTTLPPTTLPPSTRPPTTLPPTTLPPTTLPPSTRLPTTLPPTTLPPTTLPSSTRPPTTLPPTTLPPTTTITTTLPTTTPTTPTPTTTTTTTPTTTTPTTTTTTTIPTTTTSWVCGGSDWVLIGTACFHVSSTAGGWHQGQDYCNGLGAQLASVKTQEEQDGLAYLVDDNAWIGLHDMQSEGDHQWEDQSSLSYSNWKPGQPDNAGSFMWWGGEDCVEMSLSSSFTWNDNDCSNDNLYICRKDAVLQG